MKEYETTPEVLARVLSMCKLDKSRPPRWEPYYPLEDSGFRNGWTCSCCGKHSFVKKEICEGCDSVMTNVSYAGRKLQGNGQQRKRRDSGDTNQYGEGIGYEKRKETHEGTKDADDKISSELRKLACSERHIDRDGNCASDDRKNKKHNKVSAECGIRNSECGVKVENRRADFFQ